MAAQVEVSRDGPLLRLTLANPPANALSIAVMYDLQAGLYLAANDESVAAVIISASGRLFCGGHDLKELTAHFTDPDKGRGFFEDTFDQCSRLMRSIVDLPKPVLAEVDGIATAAGCQLVASCDLAYASDMSRFGVNGIDVGLFCSTPAVALTRNVTLKRAMEMLLTGQMIDAATAAEIGLINRAVKSSSLRDVVTEVATTIAAKSPIAVRLGKKAVYEQAGMGLAEAYACASRTMVDNLLDPAAVEGISGFLAKRRQSAR